MSEALLSPLVDFLFKRLFGDEKNTDLPESAVKPRAVALGI